MMMKTAVLKKIGTIEYEERAIPEPGPGEVLVKIRSVGICGSDLHYYTHGKIGSFVVEKPLVLGHESAGEIVALGAAVTDRRVGDRVSLEPGIPCRKCEFCKTGRYNLCPDVRFMATPPVDGAFAEYVVSPADFAFKIPDAMTYDEAALMEPLAVGVYAAEKAGLKPGMSTAVLGMGPIGMVVAQAAKAYGAYPVAGVDMIDFRLEKAAQLGVDRTFNGEMADLEGAMLASLNRQPEVVFETAGASATLNLATHLVKPGGTIVMIGMSPADFTPINQGQILGKELKILGIFRYANMYPKAIELVQSGKVNVKALATHTFALDQTKEALDFALEHKGDSIKVMIHP